MILRSVLAPNSKGAIVTTLVPGPEQDPLYLHPTGNPFRLPGAQKRCSGSTSKGAPCLTGHGFLQLIDVKCIRDSFFHTTLGEILVLSS